ncbi:hypothetical protein H5410_010722 [Solanum commersonii]|uniref:Uncharacterized protein n=1 Tax=Solanum commersonii TaxID=4109 RepID=A0A9J6ALH4_SOLCO|nr:hypothetical protein H5410_010722 [Solanum commersonii]
MEKKKMNAVAVMAMVFIVLLSANMNTVSIAVQGKSCYDNGCAGMSIIYINQRIESKIDGNLAESVKMY